MVSKLGHFGRNIVILICLVAWVEFSNHCALATLRCRPVESQQCCSSSREKKTKQDSREVCCQKLPVTEQVAFALPAMTVGVFSENFATTPDFAVPTPVETALAGLRFGDPPPAETVFCLDSQRCHPAFAPPVLN